MQENNFFISYLLSLQNLLASFSLYFSNSAPQHELMKVSVKWKSIRLLIPLYRWWYIKEESRSIWNSALDNPPPPQNI